jgi:hypothetical protein
MDDAVKHDQDELMRLQAGEDVPVQELSYAAARAIFKEAGCTRSDFYRMARMRELDEAGFEEFLAAERHRTKDRRGETRALNKFINQRQRPVKATP